MPIDHVTHITLNFIDCEHTVSKLFIERVYGGSLGSGFLGIIGNILIL